MVRAFKGSTPYQVADLPPIDVLIISHDHYDHLDYETIRQLRDRVKRVIVPMGVGSHFLAWGYPPHIITELYWDQAMRVSDRLTITATPARHFSNRSFANNKTLWASYVIQVDDYRLFYSGDGGYGRHFKRIGRKYGPFDLAMMECGQYNVNWSSSHMFPAQTARAAADLQVRTLLPVHWGKFRESFHPWNEPIRLLLPAADSLHVPVTVPRIGEPYTVGDPVKNTGWWDFD
jgi:L-ascorbate metabolism protein UlaG (beta-lactamase superfamily)